MDVRGLKILKKMSRDELIEEILAYQRAQLGTVETTILKSHVVDFRTNAYRDSLMDEASITMQPGIFGSTVQEKNEDDGPRGFL